jgi:hypothetical protein
MPHLPDVAPGHLRSIGKGANRSPLDWPLGLLLAFFLLAGARAAGSLAAARRRRRVGGIASCGT